MEGYAQLLFEVSEKLSDYRRSTEAHMIALRRIIQSYDRLAPHVHDGPGWNTYTQGKTREG